MKSALGEGMPTQGTFDSNTCHSDRPDKKVKEHDHKLYTDNLPSSYDSDDDIPKKKINCCGTIRPNTKGVPQNLGTKNIKLKWCEIQITRGDWMVILWMDKRDIHMLMNTCDKPAQGHFCDEQGNTTKQLAVRQDGQQLRH
jgi:hypothetical protein